MMNSSTQISNKGQPLLSVSNVCTFYGKVQALDNVSVDIFPGEIVTLIGANGAGKTTLLQSICCEPRVASGSIQYDGTEISRKATPEVMRSGLSLVPEGRRIFSRLTVEENLTMGGFFVEGDAFHKNLEHVLTLFPRLKERLKQRGGTMSGGEQQMLAIARGLMSNPRLLLLDEPSLGLAPIIIQQIFGIIETLRNEGVTIFLVEQNANQALKLADRGYVLENGKIVLQDKGDALLANSAVQEAYLGA